MSQSLAYFITFHTHGSWLHGETKGSVDRNHNRYGTAFIPTDPQRRNDAAQRMRHNPVILNADQREIIHRTIEEVCQHRDWHPHAVHVRTNHIHAVITAPIPPEKVMNDLKAWCTRRLREAGLHGQDKKLWSEHGSTHYLWTEAALADKIDYTLNRQGAPLD